MVLPDIESDDGLDWAAPKTCGERCLRREAVLNTFDG